MLSVKITGHQWWWEIEYEDSVPSQRVLTANELHIPINHPVAVKVTSRDCHLHSFWVPNLQGKRDLIPGYPDGDLACRPIVPASSAASALSSAAFSTRTWRFDVVAEPEADFERWLQGMRQPAPLRHQTDEERKRPRRVHGHAAAPVAMPSTAADAYGQVGPDLQPTSRAAAHDWGGHVAKHARSTWTAWVKDPQASKPGNQMPPQSTL